MKKLLLALIFCIIGYLTFKILGLLGLRSWGSFRAFIINL